MKRLWTSCLLLLPVLLSGPLQAASLDDILARGTIRIGVSHLAPWTLTNRGGTLEGFEIDLGNLVADDLGVRVEFRPYELDALLAAVARDEIDLIAAGLAITPARALKVEFSAPYFESGATLVTNRTLVPSLGTIAELDRAGTTIVVAEGTYTAGLAPQLFETASVNIVADAVAAEQELVAGRAHGYLASLPDARILVRQHRDTVEVLLPEPLHGSVAGFAVQRGNQSLLNFLNAWIAARTADRTIPNAHDYWFGNYDWMLHAK